MPRAENLVTIVSTKGQIILPKAIRQRRDWDVGTRLIVEDTPEGVLLTQIPTFQQARSDDVFGMLQSAGEPKTLEEMDAAVLTEAHRLYDRD